MSANENESGNDSLADASRAERLYAELRAARRRIGSLEAQIEDMQRLVHVLRDIPVPEKTPRWLKPKKATRHHTAIPTLFISDTHFDEVVDPAAVGGVNSYNREIAEVRLRRVFERGIVLTRDYLSGVRYDGAVILLGGDIVSGNIHEELARTNEDQIMGTVVHWVPQLAAGIEMWAEVFGRVHVVAVVGNHGRNSQKMPSKGIVRDNFDWLIYRWVADRLREDERITWQIPEGPDAYFPIYNTRFLLTHGNAFRGGDGQVGPLGPIIRGNLRTYRRQMFLDQPYDWLVMGHWHTYAHVAGLVVNGSLKGYDEYAYAQRFTPERPQQAFWLTTPENGVTVAAPIFADR